MANLVRQYMPVLHGALEKFLSDPIVYIRQGHPDLVTTASPLPTAEPESRQPGKVNRLFMSLGQCGGIDPVRGDTVMKDGITYQVTEVESDDFDGFKLQLRKK